MTVTVNGLLARAMQKLSCFAGSRHGIAAIEFALVMPVMALIYVGFVVITNGVALNRKVSIMAHTLADLTARVQIVTDSERDLVFSAARAVLSPYAPAGVTLVLSSVYIDSNGVAKVVWSDANRSGAALTRGGVYTFPAGAAGLAIRNSSLIVGDVTYPYFDGWAEVLSSLGFPMSAFRDGVLTMRETRTLTPRLVPRISRIMSNGTVYQ
ncbi:MULTISPECIES: TadE/TadG family type IV pilus assembly protein [unclassified Chelatococcus]|uniref:TadE/TadG family type IV pilus assembly protein n=1 Tax=unclassified Chelatococcus TaxID=2638111 RepID=UPI001BCCAD2E|nr:MULTISPECIES: TadE/TadG family type IV pilus assembly protein [unclassified Chelatococcus]CAH1662140.1 Flp pilus assembly protein TadG [Hyphomicrobiales bacterium]MBS7741350.1 pilus assembly protein [Chelatococcus sp. HY11]MBX3546168.1 pilus assembly protein [Chelatococcus sp.]MCO5077183.1 pilus assembly protein [Chelatococcus sp.]CAH1682820.1 Flp pilus assembly protein TadG [Hyphomicrobiales bacterium]